MTAPVRRMQSQIARFTRAAQGKMRELNRVSDGVIRGFGRIGAAAVGAGLAVGAALAGVIRTGAEFERTLMGAAARFGGIRRGSADFEALREAAERVGATTEFNAQQAASALEVYAAAGFNAQQAIAALPGAGELATIAGVELGEAASLAADALGALGLRTDDAAQLGQNLARVNDLIAASTRAANMSANDFSEAIAAGGNAAVSSGQSIETFGAMVATMANASIKGAEAGTAIRNVLARLTNPVGRARAALRGLGVNVADGEGNMRSMVDIIGDLQRATAGMAGVERARVLGTIFGAETVTPALALINAGAEGLGALQRQFEGASGAAAEMAGTMRDTTAGDIDGFTSAIDGVKIALFGVVAGPLRPLLVGLTEWVNKNRDVVQSGMREFLDWFVGALPEIAKWGRRIATVVGIFGAVAGAIKLATVAVAAFNFVMAMNPMVLLGMAIVAAIALIVAFWPEISAFFEGVWTKIKDVAQKVGDWFRMIWHNVTSVAEELIGAIGGFIEGVWSPIKDFLVGAFEFVVGFIAMKLTPLMPFIRQVFGAFAEGADWFMAKWGMARDFLADVWQSVKHAASTAWLLISSTISTAADTVRTAFASAWDTVAEKAAEIFDRMTEIWAPIGEFFSGLWDEIVSTFNGTVGGVLESITNAVTAVRGAGRTVLGGGPSPEVVSPQERTARTISETTNRTEAELTIRDQTGRAEMTRRPRGGTAIRLEPTGAL